MDKYRLSAFGSTVHGPFLTSAPGHVRTNVETLQLWRKVHQEQFERSVTRPLLLETMLQSSAEKFCLSCPNGCWKGACLITLISQQNAASLHARTCISALAARLTLFRTGAWRHLFAEAIRTALSLHNHNEEKTPEERNDDAALTKPSPSLCLSLFLSLSVSLVVDAKLVAESAAG